MLYYSKEVVNNLGASRSWDKGWYQWNWALLRDSLLSEYMGMIGYSHRMVTNEIGLKCYGCGELGHFGCELLRKQATMSYANGKTGAQ